MASATITQAMLKAKGKEVDKLWREVNLARIAAAKAEREFADMRYKYIEERQ